MKHETSTKAFPDESILGHGKTPPSDSESTLKIRKYASEERHPLKPRVKVRKYDAADFLLVSPRHLQRLRKRYKLTSIKIGRDSYYFLDELLNAILEYNLPYNEKVFEIIKSRYTKILSL